MSRAARVLASAIIALAACGPRAGDPRLGTPPARRGDGIEVTLYRDHAVVAHRMRVVIPPASYTAVRLRVAAGIDPDDVYLGEPGPLKLREVRRIRERGPDEPPAPDELELIVSGPAAGAYPLVASYATERITWNAAYSLTTTTARDHAVLRGSLAVRNTTGLTLRSAYLSVVDGEHGPIAHRTELGAHPIRELGRVDLIEGDTRIELIAHPRPWPIRAVLVYDPIGTRLDHPGDTPVRDPELGVRPPGSTRVAESFEITRDRRVTEDLPAGRARLLERRDDGSLAVLGQARLYDAATRGAAVDTIPIGTADGVTGKRERRELTVDDPRQRIVEEFAITLDNARPVPVEVVLHEHFYRGQAWTLAYLSLPQDRAAQVGPQQVALRVRVPPRGRARVLYVVVYPWGENAARPGGT